MREDITVEKLNEFCKNTLVSHLGIECTEFGKDYLCGKMPVDNRTKQPVGLLHGGASVVLAESLGSLASAAFIDTTKQTCVGLEINANHVKSVREGYVYGKAQALHIGKRTHLWDIKIVNEKKELVCVCRLTIAVIDKQ